MSEKPEISEREYDFQVALFSVSSALVGVCLTAIGLILVAERMSEYRDPRIRQTECTRVMQRLWIEGR